ncbi:hypothetical protein NEIRO02_2625, partial [Nematocida sp. AWRm79]
MYLFNYNNKLNMFNEGEIKTLTEVAKTTILYNDCVYRGIDKILFTPNEFNENQRFITHCIINNDMYTKYLGKYAFIRQFHMQEVISCVFSILCMVCALNCIIYTMCIKYKYINKSNNTMCNKSYNNKSYKNNNTMCNKSCKDKTNNTLCNKLCKDKTNNTLCNKSCKTNSTMCNKSCNNNNTVCNKLCKDKNNSTMCNKSCKDKTCKTNNTLCNKLCTTINTEYSTHSTISNNYDTVYNKSYNNKSYNNSYKTNNTVCNNSYNLYPYNNYYTVCNKSYTYNTHSIISNNYNTMYNILYTLSIINNTIRNILYPYNTNNNTISNKLYTYINILLIYYSINTVTWLFSALFHIRDIYITQCVDYFSAILSLFTSIAISLYRLYLINTHYVISLIWFIHVLYMLTNFNFMYNSIICGIFYCINVLLWYNWYVFIKEYSYSRILVLIISGMCISVLF